MRLKNINNNDNNNHHIYRTSFMHHPVKISEAVVCGKPIIAIKGTSMAQILIEENCGLVIGSNNVDELRLAISSLMNNPTLAINLKISIIGILWKIDYQILSNCYVEFHENRVMKRKIYN